MPNINGLHITMKLFRPHDPSSPEGVAESAEAAASLRKRARELGCDILEFDCDYRSMRKKADVAEAAE